MKRAMPILIAAFGMLLGASQLAHASDYSGNCADVSSWDGSGNATITDSNCTISNDLTATGYISINASGTVNTQALSAGNSITIIAGGTINTQDISAAGAVNINGGDVVTISGDINDEGYTIVVVSQADVSLQNIENDGGTGGDVRIFANYGGSGSDAFQIGSAGATNGVGTIDNDHTNASAIYVSNGGSGGINFSGTLTTSASDGQTGGIYLDTRGGTGPITLAGGTISTPNTGSYPGGVIQLMTSTSGSVIVSADTTLASSGTGAAPNGYFIYLATDQVTLNAALNVTLNGQGPIFGEVGGIFPTDSIVLTVPTDPTEGMPGNGYAAVNNPLSITGSGSMSWYITGDYNGIEFYGDGLTFTASTTITDDGSNNVTYIGSVDASNDPEDITIGSVQTYVNAQSSGQTPGVVTLSGDEITSVTGSVLLDASSYGGANGGTVNVYLSEGSLPLGSTGNTLSLSAATIAGGNGGTINVQAGSADITVGDEFGGPNVSVYSDTGNGGTIDISGNSFTGPSGVNAPIFADGNGTGGAGGNITIAVAEDLTIDGNDGDFALIASAIDSGNGGNITLSAGGTLTLDGYGVYAPGETDGSVSGNGGTITVNDTGTLYMENGDDLDASGALNGNGGTISLTADDIEWEYSQLVTANASGSGNGGTITLNSGEDLYTDGDDVQINANATGTGNGGTINLTAPDVTVDGGYITVTTGSTGNGGTISIVANSGEGNIEVDNNLDASGGSDQGNGGNITLNSDGELTTETNGLFSANGNGTGDGGTLTITTGSTLDIGTSDDSDFQLEAEAQGSGNGGTVTVTAAGDATADPSAINVTPAVGQGGNGGNISLTSTGGTMTVTAELDANGDCAGGSGGNVTVLGYNAVSLTGEGHVDAGSGTCPGIRPEDIRPRTPENKDGGTYEYGSTNSNITIGESGIDLHTASGSGTGNGGTIIVFGQTVTADGSFFNVQAGQTNTDGQIAGNIMITGSQNITITNTLDASGGEYYAKGGTISIDETGTGQIDLSDAILTASAGSFGNADGNSITVTNTNGSAILLSGTNLFAYGAGTGNGGTITVSGNPSATTDISSAYISAIGGTSGGGQGGTVIVTNGYGTGGVNVFQQIKVNGGPSVGAADFDGSIQIFGVTCQQWATSYSWPTAYWNCKDPTSSTDNYGVPAAASSLGAHILPLLAESNVQIMVMDQLNYWNLFFSLNASGTNVGGITRVEWYTSTGFATLFNGSGFTSNPYTAGDAVHEIGHDLDRFWGGGSTDYSQISNGDWETAYDDDTAPGSSINSAACTDVFPADVCSAHPDESNWGIFVDIYSSLNDQSEMFANLFEHEESVLNSGSFQMSNGIEQALQFFPNMSAIISTAISTGTP